MAKTLRGETSARLLTAKELALLIGISFSTLAKMRLNKLGPPYIKIGNSVRYDLDAVKEYLDSQIINPSEDLAM